MNKKEQLKKDSDIIEEAMKKYGGSSGAHFGFVALATGERQFFAGGNLAITGICLAEAIAVLIHNTPGMAEDGSEEFFVDTVAETAKEMLQHKNPLQ